MKLKVGQKITVGSGSDQDTGIIAKIVDGMVTVQWDSEIVTTQPMEALLAGGWVRFYLAPRSWNSDGYRYIVTEGEIREQFDTFKLEGDPDWDCWQDARDECDELDAEGTVAVKCVALGIAGSDLSPADRPTCREFVEHHHGQKYVEVHNAADCLEWGDLFPLVDTNGLIVGVLDTGTEGYVELDLYSGADGELFLDDADADGVRLGSMVAARLTG